MPRFPFTYYLWTNYIPFYCAFLLYYEQLYYVFWHISHPLIVALDFDTQFCVFGNVEFQFLAELWPCHGCQEQMAHTKISFTYWFLPLLCTWCNSCNYCEQFITVHPQHAHFLLVQKHFIPIPLQTQIWDLNKSGPKRQRQLLFPQKASSLLW